MACSRRKLDGIDLISSRRFEVTNVLLFALQSEFADVTRELAVSSETQRQLRAQVDSLQCERDILLEELERSGLVNASLR